MLAHQCERCGATYPDAYEREWGKSRESNGAGPKPVCTALVEDPSTPPAKDSSGEIVAAHGFAMCGGSLQRTDVAEDAVLTVAELTPIKPGKTA